MAKTRPYLGDWMCDDDVAQPGRRMPNLASALVVQARQRSGLSQSQLAERVGTSRSAISAIEHGKRDPGLEHLQAILRAAGFDLLTRLVDHDSHDDVLGSLAGQLSPDQRTARNEALGRFGKELRAAMADSRPLLG